MSDFLNVATFTNLTSSRVPFTIDSCTIRPSGSFLRDEADRNDIFDLANFVTSIEITESIYKEHLELEIEFFLSPELIGNDDFQRFKLYGDEIISITFSVFDNDEFLNEGDNFGNPTTTRRIDFYVTDYPFFSRDIYTKVELVKCKAISRHAYLGKFLRLSKSVKGYTNEIIFDIFKDSLKLKNNYSESFGDALLPEIQDGNKGRRTSLILPNFSAIDTIRWLARNSFDAEGFPFYCFHSFFDNKIHIKSHETLVSAQPEEKTFVDNLQFEYIQKDENIVNENLERIISFNTNFGISKFVPGIVGAFSSETNFLNIFDKSFTKQKFNYIDSNTTKLNRLNIFRDNTDKINLFNEKDSNDIEIGISKLNSVYRNNISLNSGAFENIDNYHGIADGKTINRRDSYIENIDTVRYYMVVNGNLSLNVGKIINVQLSNIYYDNEDNENLALEENLQNDEYTSGKYLITSVKHTFNLTKDNTYVSTLTLKKDSFDG